MTDKDIKRSTVDKVAERLKKTSGLSSEQAHKIARTEAERINRERKGQSK